MSETLNHLTVQIFTEGDNLHAHALQLGVSIEADTITSALRRLADEIDDSRALDQTLDSKVTEIGVKRART